MSAIPQSAQLHELPDYWQEQIRKLRSESKNLRLRLREAELASPGVISDDPARGTAR